MKIYDEDIIERLDKVLSKFNYVDEKITRLEDKFDALVSHLGLIAIYHLPEKRYWHFENKEDRDVRKETK